MSMLNENYREMHGGEGVQCATCFRYTKTETPVRHTEECAVGIEERVIASASSKCPLCGVDTPHTHSPDEVAANAAAKEVNQSDNGINYEPIRAAAIAVFVAEGMTPEEARIKAFSVVDYVASVAAKDRK